MFSARLSASIVASARNAWIRPLLSTIISTTSLSSPSMRRPSRTSATKSPSALRTLAENRPVSAVAISQAWKNEQAFFRAKSSILEIDVDPMPRRGVLITRLTLISSAGFTIILRYAMTSRISARSKNRVPPTIL